MVTAVDWSRLARAMDFYQARGYRRVELPWAVDDRIVAVTAPHAHWRSQVPGLGSLIGSAEQGFLSLDAVRALDKGKFVALTPCFRVAEIEDDTHQKTFMKVELYANADMERAALQMIDDAYAFYEQEKASGQLLDVIRQPDGGIDINLDGIEVGSYGTRTAVLEEVEQIDRAEFYLRSSRDLTRVVRPPQYFSADEIETAELPQVHARLRVHQRRELAWAYGTGLAEPRFTYARTHQGARPSQRIIG